MSHAGQLLAESPHLSRRGSAPHARSSAATPSASAASSTTCSACRAASSRAARAAVAGSMDARSSTRSSARPCSGRRRGSHCSGAGREVEVRVDPDQLRQIVWNLCENAIKHAVAQDAGRRRSRYATAAWRAARARFSRWPIAARGVPPEHAERIFEPFYSGGRGTGLGLFLARELAQTNGATLLYEPRSRRRQHLQAGVRRSAPLGGLMNEAATATARLAEQPVVLVVDDEPDLLELVSLTLSRMNLQTRTAADLGTRAPAAQERALRPVPDGHAPAGRRRTRSGRLDPGEPRRPSRWR